MKNQTRFLLAALVLIMACTTTTTTNEPPAKETSKVSLSDVDNATIQSTIDTLKAKFGEASAPRIEKGVKQAAAFWSKADGTPQHFQAFCKHNFIASEAELDLMFKRISDNLESIFGSFHKINVDLKLPMDVDMGEILKIDEIFGSYSPAAHFTDDMFSDKVAFIVLLNFPHYTLAEKTTLGPGWTRKQWAYARLGEMFTSRTPGEINQKINDVLTASDFYISNYNIYLGNLRDDQGKKLFPDNLKLISHWGIRDELKADYNEPDGLAKQKLIYQVMLQIIRQDIPKEVINNAELVWNPYTNKVWKNDVEQKVVPEPDTRYQHLLNEFKEIRKADPYNPFNPDYISRKFDREMEIPEKDVEALFVNLISSPEIKLTGQLISKRLGRPLEPFDIWYDGFKSRSGISQSELDKVTKAKYPNKEAF